MHRTIPLILLLFASIASAQRHRIVSLPDPPQAKLSGQIVDLTTAGTIVEVVVEVPRRFARGDAKGKFTLQLPIGQPITLKFSRTGYETLTETVTITGDTTRTFQLRPLPTARITDVNGTTYTVDADTVE